jgi:hypothetical protein
VEWLDLRCSHEGSNNIIRRKGERIVTGRGGKPLRTEDAAAAAVDQNRGERRNLKDQTAARFLATRTRNGGVMVGQATENKKVRGTAFRSGFYLRDLIGRLGFNE